MKCPFFSNLFQSLVSHRRSLILIRWYERNSNLRNQYNRNQIEIFWRLFFSLGLFFQHITAFLEYIYLEEAALQLDLVMDLPEMAEKYSLPQLEMECANYLFNKITSQNVLRIVELA